MRADKQKAIVGAIRTRDVAGLKALLAEEQGQESGITRLLEALPGRMRMTLLTEDRYLFNWSGVSPLWEEEAWQLDILEAARKP